MEKTIEKSVKTAANTKNGYLSETYIQALKRLGQPLCLEKSAGWLLERPIPGSDKKDLCGPYPLFCCTDWLGLKRDVENLNERFVSLSFVSDPLGEYDEWELKSVFTDVCYPYKTHYVVDFFKPLTIEKNHRRNIARSKKNIDVFRESEPTACLDEWNRLYGLLIRRHGIKGVARFSGDSFGRQFNTPGLRVYSARFNGRTVGMVLFYVMGDSVYYHLGAYDAIGYTWRASFAIFSAAIADFRGEGLHYLNLGSGAGLDDDPADGLSRFKRGWANEQRTAWFCGQILNQKMYKTLAPDNKTRFFPAYRQQL